MAHAVKPTPPRLIARTSSSPLPRCASKCACAACVALLLLLALLLPTGPVTLRAPVPLVGACWAYGLESLRRWRTCVHVPSALRFGGPQSKGSERAA